MTETVWPQSKTISVVVDPPGWFTPFGQRLTDELRDRDHTACLLDAQEVVTEGDIAFYLS